MKTKFNSKTVFLTAFLISAAIILPVMLINGGKLYLIGDYMSQQIPFIDEARRMLKSSAPFWSVNSFLGVNFIGTYSFYNIASPFYWPIYLMPQSMTAFGTGLMFCVKSAVAALTAFLYLKKSTTRSHLAFIGALIYAFSGFAVDSSYFYHFHDVLAVFPLIPLLADEVLQGRKNALFSLCVALNAMVNYYFFVASSVFFLIYLFFKVKYDGFSIKDALRTIVHFYFGALAAAFVLLPSALSLLETNKATGSFSRIVIGGLGNIPQLLKILKGIVLPSEGILSSAIGFNFAGYNSNSVFLPFFGAVFLFIALKRKESSWEFKLVKFLFFLSVVPFGNGVFSLFTNLSYTRWWYAFSLIIILISIKLIDTDVSASEYKQSAKTIAAISAAVIGIPLMLKLIFAYSSASSLIELLPQAAVDYLKSADLFEKLSTENLRYAAVLIITTLLTYLPLAVFIKKDLLKSAKHTVPAVILICTLSYSLYLANEVNIFEGKNSSYKGADISASEDTVYTSRTFYDYAFANYPQTANRPGITGFSSFKSHSTAKFCRLVGFVDTPHLASTRYFDTPAIQAILSIEALVSKNGRETKAPYYVPFGFSYEYYILIEGYEYSTDKQENNRRIELMTKAAFLDQATAKKLGNILEPLDISSEIDLNASVSKLRKTAATDFQINTKGFTAKTSGEKERLIFFSIPHDNGWSAYINGKETEIYTVNGGLMAIVAPEGEAEIEFIFTTPGLYLGIILSSLAILLIICSSFKKKY